MKSEKQISLSEAINLVKAGDTLLQGGLGMKGTPVQLLHALAERGTKHLTIISNSLGEAGVGAGRLLRNGQVKKIIGSYFTSNPEAVRAAQKGLIEYELLPQGTLAEAIRAGGAGIGGFYTPTAAGTELGKNKEVRFIKGQKQIFIESIVGNVAFIRAWRADSMGNLQYRKTEQNFNKAMATAADIVIAEVEEILSNGTLASDNIHTPGIYVNYLVETKLPANDMVSSAIESSSKTVSEAHFNIAKRALAELKCGDVVNLGMGIPKLVANFITPEHGIMLHSEDGKLGISQPPKDEDFSMNHPASSLTGHAEFRGSFYFDSVESFAMIRGKDIDIAVMGGLEVDEAGNLANWCIPGQPSLGVGGAMDLASGAKRVIITMTHTKVDGTPKIVEQCKLPLTAMKAVDLIITDLAVFRFIDEKLTLVEIMPGASFLDIQTKTAARFNISLNY